MKTTRYIAKCKTCNTYTSAPVVEGPGMGVHWNKPADGLVYIHQRTGDIVINCRVCRAPKFARMVKGKLNPAHECNAKCMSSHGFVCECSCGGKNHGGGYEAAP